MSALTDLPIERLEAEIQQLHGELANRLERWLALVAEYDRRGAARRWGFRSTGEWLAWHCGLSQRAARDHVRVARGLATRPQIRAAFSAGELSYSKVRALTRAPEGEDEATLLETARTSTAGQLERTVRSLRMAESAGLDAANRGHGRRYLQWWWEPDGALGIRGCLPADEGAAFIEVIERAAASLHAAPDPADEAPAAPPPIGARRADALAEIALSGARRAQVVVHVDEPALRCTATVAKDREGEVCALEDGPAIPSETARRLACDGDLVHARLSSEGQVDYGRSRRIVPPPLRAALERRDRGCRFPCCERRHDLHAHHIRHWAHGGATDRENLIMLCRFHHRAVHEGEIAIERAGPDRLRFRAAGGRIIEPVPRGQPPPAEAVAA
jgi:hypothetical protein